MALKRVLPPDHPGPILKAMCIEPLGLSVTAAAEGLGVSRKHLSNVINGKVSITADLALRIAKAFKTTPEIWTRMQTKYDIWEAEQEADLDDVVVFEELRA